MANIDGLGNLTPTAGIVSLIEAKTHLRFPDPTDSSSDDVNLQGFIYAATEVIEGRVGNVVQRTVKEYHTGGSPYLYVREKPIVSVTTIVENWGYYNWTLTEVDTNDIPQDNLFAYSVDNPDEGLIVRRSVGNIAIPFMGMGDLLPDNITVTYVTGMQGTPWSIRLACLELIAHWWQASQQRTSAASASPANPFNAVPSVSNAPFVFGVPNRIWEIIGTNGRTPIIG